jgi:hypothetical protein
VFATVSPDTGDELVGRFYRMLACFRNNHYHVPDAPITFYRIRAIYEITGSRMQYVKDSVIKSLLEG